MNNVSLSRKANLVNDRMLLFVSIDSERTSSATIRSYYFDVLISDNFMFNFSEMNTTEVCRENHYILLIS